MPGPLDRGWSAVVCVGSGPSFSTRQAEAIEAARASGRWRVIVCNNAWQRIPNADALYACDGKWWNAYAADVARGFRGERWTRNAAAAAAYGLRYIRSTKAAGLTKEPDAITEGGNSGYQAVNLAYLFGARRIVLVGYDMQLTNKRTHFHGDHPRSAKLANARDFTNWIERFRVLALDMAAAGIVVNNGTEQTALDCFPRVNLEDELAWIK